MILKAAITMILFFVYKTDLKFWIKFLTMMDFAIDVGICASIYPLLSIIAKNDKLYATTSIMYDGFYYLESLVATFLVGKNISGKIINYNTYAISLYNKEEKL